MHNEIPKLIKKFKNNNPLLELLNLLNKPLNSKNIDPKINEEFKKYELKSSFGKLNNKIILFESF